MNDVNKNIKKMLIKFSKGVVKEQNQLILDKFKRLSIDWSNGSN